MKHFILFFTVVVTTYCTGQNVGQVSAKIVNSHTQKPIALVNVNLIQQQMGAVTDDDGTFNLPYQISRVQEKDLVEISSMGYETRKLKFAELKRLIDNSKVITLTPTAYSLEEVFIKSPPRERKIIGHNGFTASGMGYWEGEEAVGGEIASVIRVKNKHTKLLNVTFKLLQNKADSIRLKLKIYEFDGGNPEKNLLTQDIYYTIVKSKGWETIDLKKYNIKTSEDIVVGLELVEIYGDSHYFSVALSAYGGMGFIREPYQRHWSVRKKACIGFKVESSHPIKTPKNLEDI
ncbi:MAG: carboxypeptidase-like regulatory domain-containing protein [Bacteroidota bacterium]